MTEELKIALAALGAITGTVALIWRLIDEFGSFLRISVKAERASDGWITVLTSVENKGNRPKEIAYALVVIGPESEDPMETARLLVSDSKKRLEATNDLEYLEIYSAVTEEDRALIPLSFYYSENINIADETITYRVPVNTDRFQPSVTYSVRFFVFAAPRLHRSTQDTFIVEAKGV